MTTTVTLDVPAWVRDGLDSFDPDRLRLAEQWCAAAIGGALDDIGEVRRGREAA